MSFKDAFSGSRLLGLGERQRPERRRQTTGKSEGDEARTRRKKGVGTPANEQTQWELWKDVLEVKRRKRRHSSQAEQGRSFSCKDIACIMEDQEWTVSPG